MYNGKERSGRGRIKQSTHDKKRKELSRGFQVRTQFDGEQDIVDILRVLRSEVGNKDVALIMILRAFLDDITCPDESMQLVKNMIQSSEIVDPARQININLKDVITTVGPNAIELITNFIIMGYLNISHDMINEDTVEFYAEKILKTLENN